MKKTIFFVLLILSSFWTFGQQNYPKGVYLTTEEIRQKMPSLNVELDIDRRTNGDIKMTGGNDFKLNSLDESITKGSIKKDYRGYSKGDTLFINCSYYKIQSWYTPVLSNGKFLVIRAGISSVPKIQKAQLKNKALLGNMFGAVGGAFQGAKLAMIRLLYVINIENDEITTVSSDYVKELIKSNTELATLYKSEAEPEKQKTLFKYLKMYNEL